MGTAAGYARVTPAGISRASRLRSVRRDQLGGERLNFGSMAVLAPGISADFVAEETSVVMALGGEPLGPRFIGWNFVSSSRERIEQAKADWRAGRMKLPDLDQNEWIPLLPDPTPPANPLS
ncbi:pirin-like C-terminal cupin domain-containing protein [Sphingosinicella rhizophila]|uniref:Pirin-like C-terminal cupin domain-containing protein n=1 Tax=Sphingosinicella rhizophila TaxID=3050082 RepID=A0ABU3QCD9_9SPHN|nr:pirin-like C-terminal cupin domain-containing protein [Sphingosinicella sp. GR2756]MDT9601068.1 pirin-like C-terminal cupin domain-containing protein [Sphingosinicella sp. GR2756]